MNAYLIRSFWFKDSFHIYTIANPAEAVVSAIRITSYSVEMQISITLCLEVYIQCYYIDSKYYDKLYSPCIGRHEALSFLSGDTKTKQTGCQVIGQLRCSLSWHISLCAALDPANLGAVVTPWTCSSTGFFSCFSMQQFQYQIFLRHRAAEFKKNIDPSIHICGNSKAVD